MRAGCSRMLTNRFLSSSVTCRLEISLSMESDLRFQAKKEGTVILESYLHLKRYSAIGGPVAAGLWHWQLPCLHPMPSCCPYCCRQPYAFPEAPKHTSYQMLLCALSMPSRCLVLSCCNRSCPKHDRHVPAASEGRPPGLPIPCQAGGIPCLHLSPLSLWIELRQLAPRNTQQELQEAWWCIHQRCHTQRCPCHCLHVVKHQANPTTASLNCYTEQCAEPG